MARKDEKIIGFRLDRAELLRLEEAAERAGIGPHEWAKRATIRELDSGNLLPKIAFTNDAIKEELLELRQDVAVSVEAILVTSGKVSSEQALKFVTEKLRKRV